MERAFHNPPASVQTSVYWYWVSGNISAEGIVEDLRAMKRAGIGRVFIGNVGIEGLRGPRDVKFDSDEWWNCLRTALRTAGELDIEVGIFNGPGWSQSGGPWVKPEESMRYLAASGAAVDGGGRVVVTLPAPGADFADVRTIAWPLLDVPVFPGQVTLLPGGRPESCLTDGDSGTNLPIKGPVTVEFTALEPFTARSLTLTPAPEPLQVEAELFALIDGGWRSVKRFSADRSNPNPNVGFQPYAPVAVSFPAVTASAFRLRLEPRGACAVAEIGLSGRSVVEHYAEKSLAKMCQTPLPYWDHYMWPRQAELDDFALAVDPSAVVDLSDRIAPDGKLDWQAPPGRWRVLRLGMLPTGVTNAPAEPEATGLETDKMSRRHVERHFEAFIGRILERIPAEERRTFRVVVQDSYETGGQNFTDDFLRIFRTRYGYDPLPYLPALYGEVIASPECSDRFLWDLRRLVADKVACDYVGGLRDICHCHGLRTWLENYGHWGFPGEFLQYGGQSDEIGGEFWSVGELGDIENRAASSCGHIYGKQLISAESNTCGGPAFMRSPAMMKQRTDRFFAEGINNTLLHLYIQQPDDSAPGMNAWFGNEFNRHNTWFPQLDLFIQYLKRCNYLLRQGLNVADVAYFIGEDAPKMTGVQDPPLPQRRETRHFTQVSRFYLYIYHEANFQIVGFSFRVLESLRSQD